jgi:hypothetical protein
MISGVQHDQPKRRTSFGVELGPSNIPVGGLNQFERASARYSVRKLFGSGNIPDRI